MRTRAGLLGVIAVLVTACDTGDGTTLRDPAPDAPPPTDVPIGTIAPEPTAEPAPATTSAPTLPAPEASDRIAVVAPWPDGEVIDPRYGCDGLNASPELSWSGVPDGTVELAVSLVNDSDLSRGQPFVHWIMWGIDPTATGLTEAQRPPGSLLALNFFGNVDYDGPCPNPGDTGVYRLRLHALSQQLEVADGVPAAEVFEAIEAVTIAEAATLGSMTR